MRKFLKRSLVSMLMASIACSPTSMAQQAQSPSLCAPSGFSLGFFNGVWNTDIDADSGAAALGVLVGTKHLAADTAQQEDIKTTTFYNTTGSSIGATRLQDVAGAHSGSGAERRAFSQQRMRINAGSVPGRVRPAAIATAKDKSARY